MKSILKKTKRHSAATRTAEVAEHRDAVLNMNQAGSRSSQQGETEPDVSSYRSCRRLTKDHYRFGRAKDSLEMYSHPRSPPRRPPRILKPLHRNLETIQENDPPSSCASQLSFVLTIDGLVRRDQLPPARASSTTIDIDLDEDSSTDVNKSKNAAKKGHAIARGELFPPLDTPVHAEYGLVCTLYYSFEVTDNTVLNTTDIHCRSLIISYILSHFQ